MANPFTLGKKNKNKKKKNFFFVRELTKKHPTRYDDERGLGAAMGTNLNVPLPYPITDAIYERELAKALDALVAFDPKYLVVSLGVDIYSDDPLSSFGGISIAGFERIGQLIAGKLEHLPTVVVQEGGYNEEMTGACVSSFFKGLTR